MSSKRGNMYFLNPHIDKFIQRADVVVFDLNGLIIDDEPIQLRATNEVLVQFGKRIDETTWISMCVGFRPAEYLPAFVPAGVDVRSIVEEKDRLYASFITDNARELLRPGFHTLIDYLTTHHKRIALATSTTEAGVAAILGNKGLAIAERFACIVTGDQVKRAKPAPEIYDRVRSYCGQTLYYVAFEDSEVGINSATAAGMDCIAVPNRFTADQDMSRASLVLDCMAPGAKILMQGSSI
jgi:HAD superfamily hydrolase (TIGR01509 family)